MTNWVNRDCHYSEYMNLPRTEGSIYASLAKLSFVIFLFFMFFGTSLPFRDRITEVDDIGTSNIVNQVVYTLLFLISFFSLLPKTRDVVAIIKKEKFLFLFLLWCFASLAWSDYSFVSFKRLFRDVVIITVCFAALVHSTSVDELLKYFKYILFFYILITVLSIVIVPGATDEYGQWRGLATHKNHLGQVSLVSAMIWFYAMRQEKFPGKVLGFIMLLLSVILLLGSSSMTSLLTFALVTAIGIILFFDNFFKPLGVGRLFSFLIITSLVCIGSAIMTFGADMINDFFYALGKDITFTGRTDFWADIFIDNTKNHLLLGTGFGGFWVVDNPNLLDLYEVYNWLPNQGHNGYLDILNETGIVGLLLFALMVCCYFINLTKLKSSNLWKWFIIATLILNLQESTILRHGILTGVLFVFAYLALYTQLYKDEQFSFYKNSRSQERETSRLIEAH